MKIKVRLTTATHETKYGIDGYVRVVKKNETVAGVIKAMQEECDFDEYFDSYTDAIVIDTDDFEEVR